MLDFLKRHPLGSYFVLAYLISWGFLAFLSVSFLLALAALFGPALSALIVTAVSEGRTGVKDLMRKAVMWRVGIQWYLAAAGIPAILSLVVLVVNAVLLGKPISLQPGGEISLTIILAFLVIGEELGWRGFALPRLQARYNDLSASLILGGLWAAWHLANILIPGLEYYGYAFPAFLLYVVSMTVLFTWLVNKSRGSVLIAWIFHASINVSGSVFFIGDQVREWWLSGAIFGLTAISMVLLTGLNLGRSSLPAPTETIER
jgi:membrane protease YdiL (CAAX protease family)